MKIILDNNEKAYFKRYGMSLTEIWNTLTIKQQEEALAAYDHLAVTEPCRGLSFEQENVLRIVIGYGGSLCFKKILDNALPAMRAVIWEPEIMAFLAGCVREDIHEYLENESIAICIGRDRDGLVKCLLNNVLVTNAFHNKMMAIGSYVSSGNKDVALFSSCYIKVTEEVLGEGNSMKHFHRLSCENWLNAISILNNNYLIGQLFEKIETRDIPVIIVAAGPSLVKNCHELRNAKGRALIISVTHALSTLRENDIKPDLTAVKDSKHFDFTSCDEKRENILLSSVYASRNDQNSYNGRVIFWGFRPTAGLFHTKRTDNYPEVLCGTGSVATDVFSLFADSGFRRIILVGQDLAYNDEGYSHSDGKKESSEIIYETEGLYGNTVRTRCDWEYMRRSYESKIDGHRNIRVIDATEGGARIRGTEIMSLKEAIEQCCNTEYPVAQWIGQLRKGDDEEREQIDRWFIDCINDCESFNRHLDRIIEQNRRILNNWKDTEKWDDSFSALCKRYDVMYDIIMNGDSGFVLKHYSIGEIQKYIENALILEGDENIEKRMELEYDLFTFMRNMGDELINYLEELKHK